jgi:uncharacterized protein YqcC (DUF446 family)
MSQNTGDPNRVAAKPVVAPAAVAAPVEDHNDVPAAVASAPVAEAAPAGDNSRAQDILAMIRNRQK